MPRNQIEYVPPNTFYSAWWSGFRFNTILSNNTASVQIVYY
jgi:hypothetical protein